MHIHYIHFGGSDTNAATSLLTVMHGGQEMSYLQDNSKLEALSKAVLISILGVAIVLSNLLIIATYINFKGPTEVINYYLLSLAVADLLCGLLVVPFSVYPALTGEWMYGDIVCRFTGYLEVTLWAVSVYTFMWISVDRYLAVRKPLRYETVQTKTRCQCWMAFTWISAALLCCPPILGYTKPITNDVTHICMLDWGNMAAYSATLAILVLGPSVISIVYNYGYIFIMMRKIKSGEPIHDKEYATALAENLSNPSHMMSFALVFAFWMSWLPWMTLRMYEVVTGDVIQSTLINFAVVWIGVLNSFWKIIIMTGNIKRNTTKNETPRTPIAYTHNSFEMKYTTSMEPMFFSPPNGIPSESKLATYMSRQNVVTPTYGLATGFSLLNLDSHLNLKATQVPPQSPEFIPNRLNSPNFYSPYQAPLLSNGLTNGPAVNGMTTGVVKASNGGGGGNGLIGLQQKSAVVQTVPPTKSSMQPTQHTLVNGGNIAASASASQIVATSATQQYNHVNIASTPLKNHNNLLQNESPESIDAKSPPRLTPPHSSPIPTTLPVNVHQENVGGTIYFYPTAANHTTSQNSNSVVSSVVDPNVAHHVTPSVVTPLTPVQPALMYTGHVYPGPASNVVAMQPKTMLETAFFMPDEMRSEILARNEISNLLLDTSEAAHHALPTEVDNYHSLYPLEPIQPMHNKLTMPSSTYKATHNLSGIKYCLRRLHGFRLQSTKCMSVVEMWKKLHHSNVVQLREVFTTKAFGDNSLVLVYDYHPSSQTLLAKYFTPPPPESNNYPDPFQGDARPFSHKSNLQRTGNGPLLSEATIWAIIMQLTAGLRAIHQAGLACKSLDPTKIIVTGKRVRFSFCGTTDIAQFDPNVTNPVAVIGMHQQEDLTALGRLVLALACRCLQSVQRDNVQTSIDMVSRHYSSDLRNFIVYLFNTSARRSVTDLMPMIGARFYTQLDSLQCQCDMQEDELSKEMENGRLYRILVKLNCINERPDFNLDVTWSETGDRYMLKLFRDYLFHSVTEDGRPWLDHAHIVQSLNKLDAGSLERVQLMSRDEQSVLIVTYAELKNCLENAFSELVANAAS